MIIKLLRMIKHLPSQIQAICWVQFWSWIGQLNNISTISVSFHVDDEQAGFHSFSMVQPGLAKPTFALLKEPHSSNLKISSATLDA